MKRSRFSEEQIIAILKKQDSGMATADICREHGISSATIYKWRAKFGGLQVPDARREAKSCSPSARSASGEPAAGVFCSGR